MTAQPLLPLYHAAPRASVTAAARQRRCHRPCAPLPCGVACGMLPLKVALAVLLMAAVAISGTLSYTLAHAAETRSLWAAFDASAVAMKQEFQERLTLKVVASEIGAKFIATLPDPFDGDFTPDFSALGDDLLSVTHSDSYVWFTVVADANRAAFEAAAVKAAMQEEPSGVIAAQVAANGITARNKSGAYLRATPAPLYVARWQFAPNEASQRAAKLQDIYREPARRGVLDAVLNTNATVITSIVLGLSRDAPSPHPIPSSVVFSPTWIYGNRSYGSDAGNATRRSICSTGFHWTQLLLGVLPRSISAAVVVLTGPEGTAHTFEWRNLALSDAGVGDRHAELVPWQLQGRSHSFSATAAGASWTVSLYPTAALVSQFVTVRPRNNTLAVIAASLACAVLFGFYEWFVRRSAQTMNKTLSANVVQLQQMKKDVEDGCAREAQVQARLLAEEAGAKQKEQFTAMVSHEIRTPLNAMMGATALLAGTSPLNEEQRSLLQLLDAAAENVVYIVDDVLQHSALTSGKFPVAMEPLQLRRDVLDPSFRMITLQPARRDKLMRLRLTHAVDAAVPEHISADSTRLIQVLTNLLSNSVKFTREGGAIDLRVDVITTAPNDAPADVPADAEVAVARWLRFCVQDTGIGVEADKLAKIFLPFVQEDSSTLREFGGTGLGLTICLRIAKAMGGALTVASEGRDRGACFTFTIPLHECAAPSSAEDGTPSDSDGSAAAATQTHALPPGSPAGGSPPGGSSSQPAAGSEVVQASGSWPRLRVLVAEDDGLCAALMRKILVRLQVDGTLVSDGAAAVTAYQQAETPFDVILMDLHMPIMDGLAASRRIAELARESGQRPTPVVALTASCSVEEKQRCADAGMVTHLSKPIKLETLESLLHKFGDPSEALRSAAAVAPPLAAP